MVSYRIGVGKAFGTDKLFGKQSAIRFPELGMAFMGYTSQGKEIGHNNSLVVTIKNEYQNYFKGNKTQDNKGLFS
jgi:hypothetical protein